MRRENSTSNDFRYNSGKELHKWEPALALVHWMQVAVGTLMYILNSRPDLTHFVHQVARFVFTPGPASVMALDHILRYLAGTGDLCLISGNWTSVDRRFFILMLM